MLSVVIPTRNRCLDLADVLTSMTLQDTTAAFEVVVVDNGSTDATRQVVEAVRRGRGAIRYLYEATPGVSVARNSGIRAATGELLAFIDDDAVAEPGWVQALLDGFTETGADCLGGRIDGLWACPRPAWFPQRLEYLVSVFDWGAEPRLFTPPHTAPVAANMAIRREAFDGCGGFDPVYGRNSCRYLGGEEFALAWRLLMAGKSVVYWPAAVVQHKVTPARIRMGRLLRLAFDNGRMAADVQRRLRAVPARPSVALRCVPASGASARTQSKGEPMRLSPGPAARLAQALGSVTARAWTAAGYVTEKVRSASGSAS